MNNQNFNREVSDRLISELNRRKIRQAELIALCEGIGMPISQPDVSRIFSGKKTLTVYQCASVCTALEMSMDFLLWGEHGRREDFCDPHHSEALHDMGRDLKWYLGECYFYFLSTAMGEDKILEGKMEIQQEKEFYKVRLILNTGVKNLQGAYICKEYFGRILVSSSLGVAYLILKSEQIGEISMICIRHRNYSIQEMECRVGLVLTTSAGETKEPVVHKAMLVRERLAGEQIEELRPWLMLTDDNIRIERNIFQGILAESLERYPNYENQLEIIRSFAVAKEYVEVSASMLRRQLTMEREDFVNFLTLLYEKAETTKNYKVSSLEDIRVYEKILTIKEAIKADDGG